jgi:hypothetical protein
MCGGASRLQGPECALPTRRRWESEHDSSSVCVFCGMQHCEDAICIERGTVSLTLVGYGMSVTSSTGLHVSLTCKCNLPSTCCLPFDLTYTHVHRLDLHTSPGTHVCYHSHYSRCIARSYLAPRAGLSSGKGFKSSREANRYLKHVRTAEHDGRIELWSIEGTGPGESSPNAYYDASPGYQLHDSSTLLTVALRPYVGSTKCRARL